jgi:hypothetical protein
MDISYTDADDDHDAPVTETRDIPQETVNVVEPPAGGGRVQLPPRSEPRRDRLRVYGASADETCNLIKHALAALRPELRVID